MRRFAVVLVGGILFAVGALAGIIGGVSYAAPPCDRKPNHPKCQTTSGSTTTSTTTTGTTTTTPPSAENGDDLPFPVRAIFHYPWYPENWSDCGPNGDYLICGGWHLPDTPFGSRYTVNYDKLRWDINNMRRAKLGAGIWSWHGPGSNTDARFSEGLRAARDDGGKFQWTIYYELEGSTDPTVEKLRSDLAYIRQQYANHPNFLWKNNRPVVFVWTNDYRQAPCQIVDRWRQATNGWADWYVNMQVFSLWETCASGPQAWHQYGEGPGVYWNTPWNSTDVVPETWLMFQAQPIVVRSLSRFCQHLRAAAVELDNWFLITSYNEVGESTQIEPGFHHDTGVSWGFSYIDALAANGQGC